MEFRKGTKKVKVDKERFIDMSQSRAEVLKNFNVRNSARGFIFQKMEHDDEVVGMQRRYDDETKRRAVRRHIPQFFEDESMLIIGGFDLIRLMTSDFQKQKGTN
jgi:hypothetical protein